MPLMTWNDKLSVGVRILDDDHKHLVDMVNKLFDGMRAGHAKAVLGPILDELVEYTKVHFAHEEDFFAKTQYPGASAHKAEHDKLTQQVHDIQARYKAGALGILSLEVMEFLKTWLVNHIQVEDKHYTHHLNTHGIH